MRKNETFIRAVKIGKRNGTFYSLKELTEVVDTMMFKADASLFKKKPEKSTKKATKKAL